MYYPSSENKGADQLRGYCEADSASLFSPMQIVGFPTRRLIFLSYQEKMLAISLRVENHSFIYHQNLTSFGLKLYNFLCSTLY